MPAPRPYNLVAELSYRCPLRCAYCSNPTDYRSISDGLDARAWTSTFQQAAALGVVHVGLTGGEPTLRGDLCEIVAGATAAGLYTHLVTAGTPIQPEGLEALQKAGLRSVQLSIQDDRPGESDAVAGAPAFERKLAFAKAVRARGLPLALNVVLHRRNLLRIPELVALAKRLDAHRLELANTQYYGWALLNREVLLPTGAQLEAASAAVARARREQPCPEIVFVMPDYHRDRPKPCMGGWGRKTIVVAPDGSVLPCHAAAALPDLEFYSVAERSLVECWRDAPGMNAFRGEAWMREPCRGCPERARDFGGCRCQAFLLGGDAAATDPVCSLSPRHHLVKEARARAEALISPPELVHRGGAILG